MCGSPVGRQSRDARAGSFSRQHDLHRVQRRLLSAGGGPLYTASKHALVGLIRQLAHELAPRVRVNGVAPGAIPTELRGPASLGLGDSKLSALPVADIVKRSLPIPDLVQPDGYAAYYVLLASAENARNTTGTIINCDGGFNVRGLSSPSGGAGLLQRFQERMSHQPQQQPGVRSLGYVGLGVSDLASGMPTDRCPGVRMGRRSQTARVSCEWTTIASGFSDSDR